MLSGLYIRTEKHNKKISKIMKKLHKLHPEKWHGHILNPNHPFCQLGKGHPSYKNGSGKYYYKFTDLSIKLLGHNCQVCHASKNIDTHHKDGNPRNNPLDGSNWQRLCVSCHHKLHWKPKRKYKDDEERRKYRINLDRLKRKEFIEPYLLKEFGTTDVYNSKEVGKILKISRERLRQLRTINRIKFTKIGKTFFYPKNFIKKNLNFKEYVIYYNYNQEK